MELTDEYKICFATATTTRIILEKFFGAPEKFFEDVDETIHHRITEAAKSLLLDVLKECEE